MPLLRIHLSLLVLAVAIPRLLIPASALAAPILEVFEPTGENPFARNVYFCPECTPAQFEQIQVPPGFEASSSSRVTIVEAEVLSLTVPPGVAPSLDLSLDIPGDDFFYVARLLDGSVLGFDPVFGPSILAQVERDTIFTYEAGTRIHEATDPQGNLYVLFGIDTTSGIDPTQPDAFAGVPLPAGWSVSDRVLSSELSIASGGVATVFTPGGVANFQQYAVVPEPSTATPRQVDLTGGRLARFVDRDGTERDEAIAIFLREAEIVAPLPDPTLVSSTVRIFSDTADTADGGITFLDRSNWRRHGDGFVYEAHPARDFAPGAIVRILFKPGRRGGTLRIRARGDGYGANPIFGPIEYVQVAFGVGPITYVGRFQSPPASVRSNSADKVVLSGRNGSVPPPPGHELLDLSAFPDIVVWGTQDLTTEQYDAIELPPGWIRNQPRAGVGAIGRFLRSPGLGADGEFTHQEMFGATWLHQATVVGFGDSPDEEGLLRVSFVDKHHELSWRAGSSIRLLTSPDGEEYALISRDDRRTSDTPTIPNGWSVTDVYLEEDLQIQLPQPTVNIRADNEDSFQGPLPSDLGF